MSEQKKEVERRKTRGTCTCFNLSEEHHLGVRSKGNFNTLSLKVNNKINWEKASKRKVSYSEWFQWQSKFRALEDLNQGWANNVQCVAVPWTSQVSPQSLLSPVYTHAGGTGRWQTRQRVFILCVQAAWQTQFSQVVWLPAFKLRALHGPFTVSSIAGLANSWNLIMNAAQYL